MSNQTKYDVIIIGAGIGGLTCGNILAKNGLKVLILEKNSVPGGAVSTFYRNGYPIDITHSLCGLNNGSYIRYLFDYLKLSSNLDAIKLSKAFIHISSQGNTHFDCYTDFNKYQDNLCNQYPEESKGIRKLFQVMSIIWDKEISQNYYHPNFERRCPYAVVYPNLVKYQHSTFEQFLSEFVNNPTLKDILSVGWPYLGLNQAKVSALYMISTIMSYHKEGSYFIRGGFGKISRVLVKNFEELGGSIHYDTTVTDIILNNNNINQGIKTAKGDIYLSGNTISNIDTIKTFSNLLSKEKLSLRLRENILKTRLSCSAIQIHLVVKAQMPDEYLDTGSIMLESKLTNLDQPQKCTFVISIHKTTDFILSDMKNYYIINILCMPINYSQWENYLNKKNEYDNAKKTLALQVYDNLKTRFSFNQLISYNVLTPLSFAKWLDATQGAIYDTEVTPNQSLLQRFRVVMPIKNLFCVGAKSFPGPGIAGALCSSVSVADMILRGKLTSGEFVINNTHAHLN